MSHWSSANSNRSIGYKVDVTDLVFIKYPAHQHQTLSLRSSPSSTTPFFYHCNLQHEDSVDTSHCMPSLHRYGQWRSVQNIDQRLQSSNCNLTYDINVDIPLGCLLTWAFAGPSQFDECTVVPVPPLANPDGIEDTIVRKCLLICVSQSFLPHKFCPPHIPLRTHSKDWSRLRLFTT